jgi:hypothetical protein
MRIPPARKGATVLTEPYLLRHLHADRERQFLQAAERYRSVRAAALTGQSRRTLRSRPAGLLARAWRFVCTIAWSPIPSNGIQR